VAEVAKPVEPQNYWDAECSGGVEKLKLIALKVVLALWTPNFVCAKIILLVPLSYSFCVIESGHSD
jgi:hypothetical protein